MVYKAGIDMVDTFHFIFGCFHAYVVEKNLSNGATAPVCKVGVSVPTRPVAVVSEVWLQPLGGLQVEAALRAGRARRPARSGTPAASLAAADFCGVAAAHPQTEAATSPLGKPQTLGAPAQGTSRPAGAGGAHHRQVAGADESRRPAPPDSAWAALGAPGADDTASEQPGLDGGFQRLVSDPGRAASRSADGAGFVQPVPAGDPAAARPELGAGAPGLWAAF